MIARTAPRPRPQAPRSPRGWAMAGALLGALGALLAFAPAQWLASGLARASGGQVLLAQAREQLPPTLLSFMQESRRLQAGRASSRRSEVQGRAELARCKIQGQGAPQYLCWLHLRTSASELRLRLL